MKIKSILFLFFNVLFIAYGHCNKASAAICDGDVTLSSQAEVDAFQCTEVTGVLKISGTDIVNLDALSTLTRVGALFLQDNTNLTNVDGLSSLKDIALSDGPFAQNRGTSIYITANPVLANLDGLSAVETIKGFINITGNASLKTIDGFSSVTTIFGIVNISDNEALESLAGFTGVTQILALTNMGFVPPQAELRLENNASLVSIEGFSSLQEMSGKGVSLSIANNSSLISFNGLSSLSSVSGGFDASAAISISNNSSLKNLDGLSALSSFWWWYMSGYTGTISINDNAALENVDGLSSLVIPDFQQSTFYLNVLRNVSLNRCCGLYTLLQSSSQGGFSNFNISENGAACTIDDILEAGPCPPPPVVCQGDVTLSSQAEIDAFVCAEVTGILRISGNDIVNLDALSTLTNVGSLILEGNTNLANVDGLSSLAHVAFSEGPFVQNRGTSIFINENPALTNLDGLSSVETIDGFITITNNASLKTVEAFSLVTTLFGIVNISNNAALTSITGFTEVTEILSLPESGFRPEQGELRIESNASLKSIDGFSSLKKIAGVGAFLYISNNPALTDFNGLSALASIDGNIGNAAISIVNNQSLKNIDGLSSFSNLSWGFPVHSTGTININDNASLKNINGISAFRLGVESKIPTFFISIVNNPELKFCSELYPFLADLGWEGVSMLISLGNIKVEGNGASCTLEEILAAGPQTISSFSVINTQTGSEVIEFKDSVVLDLAQPDFPHLAIQANTFPKKVGSVELIFNHKSREIENVFPYIFDIRRLQLGTNAMQANVYTKSHKRGKKGVGKKSTVTLINSAEILNFEVVDVEGNLRMSLNDGDKINISDPAFKSISIKANATPASVGSVRFLLNHRFVRTENVVPYALNGDQDGNYYPWSPSPGDYTLTAIPYVKYSRNEYKGKSLTIHFKVIEEITGENYKPATSTIDQRSAPQGLEVSISAYPVPVEHELYVKINGEVGADAIVTVRNHRGDAVYLGSYSQHQSELYSINTDSMQPGVYLLQIRGSNGIYRVMKFIKK